MKIRRIYYAPRFKKSLKKIPKRLKVKFSQKEKVFRKNCFDKTLGTHKLRGVLKNYYSFSLTDNYRVMFEFLRRDEVLFVNIGTHEIYK